MRFPVHFIDRFFLLTLDRSPALACAWAFELDGPLDVKRFEQAVAGAMRLHPKASARLLESRGFWASPHWESLPELGARAFRVHPESFGEAQTLREALVEIVNQPLSPTQGPLVELHYLPRSGARPVLCYRFHHAIADGYGSLSFLRDVFTIYRGAEPPPAPALSPPALLAVGVRARIRLFLALIALHWRHSLRSRFAVPDKLFAAGRESAQRFDFVERLLDDARMERYRKAAAGVGASFNDLFVAAWALAIERWKAQDGKRCGLLRFTVNQKLRDPLFGLETLSSSFPVWVRESDRRAPKDLVRSIRKQIRDCLRWRTARAMTLMSALLKLPFPLARWLFRPLILRPKLSDSLILSNVDGAPSFLAAEAAVGRFALAHGLVVPPEGVGAVATVCGAAHGTTLILNYLTGLFDSASAERLIELVDQSLESLFSALVAAPGAPEETSPVLSDKSASG